MSANAFISYRRDHGSTLARLLKEALERGGVEAFLDVDDLGSGHFDRKLLREIESRENFVLVCTPGCLERCRDEGDFLRLEIAHAIQLHRNIVPVVAEGFAWPAAEMLPEPIRELQRHNDIAYSHRHWDSTKQELARQMRRERKAFRITIETDPERFSACTEVLEPLVTRACAGAGVDRPVEIRLLEPRATSESPQVGLVESMRAANLLLFDVASPLRERMLFRAGLAIGLGIKFSTVSSEPPGEPQPPMPKGFPLGSGLSLARDRRRYERRPFELEHFVAVLVGAFKRHAE
jgi:hypothetical protein